MKNNTNITYRRVGDFNIQNLILPPEEANITLGKWGERVPVALKSGEPTEPVGETCSIRIIF